MRKRRSRMVIIWFTVVISVVSLCVYVVAVAERMGNPRWNQVLITYSLVFWLFLAFDQIGRGVVAHSNEKRPSVGPRPRPQPGMEPLPLAPGGTLQDSATSMRAAVPTGRTQILLQRVTEQDARLLQPWLNDCVTEVLALEGQVPERTGEGDVAEFQALDWVRRESTFAFLIEAEGHTVGALVATHRQRGHQLQLLYVGQGFRRCGIASLTLQRFQEFLGMLGRVPDMWMEVSTNNMRAVRFFKYNGFGVASGEALGEPNSVEVDAVTTRGGNWVRLERLARR